LSGGSPEPPRGSADLAEAAGLGLFVGGIAGALQLAFAAVPFAAPRAALPYLAFAVLLGAVPSAAGAALARVLAAGRRRRPRVFVLAGALAPLAVLGALVAWLPEAPGGALRPGLRAGAVAALALAAVLGAAWLLAGVSAGAAAPGGASRLARASAGAGALLAILAAAVCLAEEVAARGDAAAPRNVLLISLDSVRRDVFEEYLAESASPELRRLIERSRRFRDAYTTGSHSLPSHASMLTGLYPARHGARVSEEVPGQGLGSPLAPGAPLLTAALGDAGYETVAIVHNVWLGPPYGLEAGFQTYVNRGRVGRIGSFLPGVALSGSWLGRLVLGRRGGRGELHPHALLFREWLRHRNASRPFFCLLHFIENHVPHDLPQEFVRRFARGPHAGWNGSRIARRLEGGDASPALRAALLGQLRALALAQLARVDANLAPVLVALRGSGRERDTLVLLVSDHGDDYFERIGRYGHAGVYPQTTRIPLALEVPGDAGGSEHEELVSLVDLAPTIYAFTGVAPPAGLDGIDLLSARGEAAPPRTLFAEGSVPGRRERARAAMTRERLFVAEPGASGGALYDRARDPLALRALDGEPPELGAALARELRAAAGDDAGAEGQIPVEQLPPEVREQLRQLGYVE
jgi:arylsulfatase A-like enzyme